MPYEKVIFNTHYRSSIYLLQKGGTFHITAKNAATGAPYPGLSYEIQQSWTGVFESHYKSVGSGVLDANGEVYFTKRLPKNSSYSISVGPPENTCYTNNSTLSPQGQENFNAAFEFAGCAYLKLNIHNVNCQGIGDTMKFRTKYSFYDWEGWSTNRIGCYSFDSPDYFEVPQGVRMYQWEVIRNGIKTIYNGSISLNEGESGTFNLEY